jgi:hypothetical protein
MKVWLGFSCWCDFGGSGRSLEKIFDSEEKAKTWVGGMEYTGTTHPDSEWRECEEHDVE